VFATFAQRNLDYWLQGSEEEGGCETRYVGPTQEAKAASVLPFVMNEKRIRYWYQSRGVSGVGARVEYVINDQRIYEGALLAVVGRRVSTNHCASGSKMKLFWRGISLEALCVKEYPPQCFYLPSLLSLER
jgi:hypothetical protein